MSNDLTCLGFDFGEKRIGVAVGQSLTGTANPLRTLSAIGDEPDWKAIGDLIEEWQPGCCVVGIPFHLDGSSNAMTKKARRFAAQLESRFALPIQTADETLTSASAQEHIVKGRREGTRSKTRKGDDDRIAAALILEQWFQTRNGDS